MGDVVSLAVVHFLWDFSPTFLSDSKTFQFCKLPCLLLSPSQPSVLVAEIGVLLQSSGGTGS